jgi:hypothetical protein
MMKNLYLCDRQSKRQRRITNPKLNLDEAKETDQKKQEKDKKIEE